MAQETTWLLHYGGQTFETLDGEVLDQISGQEEAGEIELRLKDDRWLKIITGPGIPIALEEKRAPSVARGIR